MSLRNKETEIELKKIDTQIIVSKPAAPSPAAAGNELTSANILQRNTDTLVSVCATIPADAAAIETFVRETAMVMEAAFSYYELLLVDNGMPADLHEAVGKLQKNVANVRMLRLSRPYDREVAIAAALDHCVGDYVVVMEAEEHPPELIPALVRRAIEGFDAVIAEPVSAPKGKRERMIAGPVYRLGSRVLGFTLKPDESYFRVFSRRLVNSLIRIRSKNRSLSSMNGLIGLRRSVVPYLPVSKPARQKRRLRRQLATIANIVVSNSAAPLRFAAGLGLLASTINLLYLFYILGVTVVKSRLAEGWLTTSLTHTLMFLLMFVMMTILAEYVARILDESKEQPLYFVESESNSTVATTSLERLNIV